MKYTALVSKINTTLRLSRSLASKYTDDLHSESKSIIPSLVNSLGGKDPILTTHYQDFQDDVLKVSPSLAGQSMADDKTIGNGMLGVMLKLKTHLSFSFIN